MTHPTNTAILSDKQRKEFIRRAGFISEADRDMRAAFVDEIAAAVIEKLATGDAVPAIDPVAWHSKQYGTCWMHLQPYHLTEGMQFYVRGRPEPVATVRSGACIVWHMSTAELPHGTFFYPSPVDATALAAARQQGRNEGREDARVEFAASGCKSVPLEPTERMCKAAADAWLDCGSRLVLNKAQAAARAAIAAAPNAARQPTQGS